MKTALLLLAPLLLLQNPQDAATTPSSTIEVTRTDGESMTGTVLSLTNDKVKMRIVVLGGTMVVSHPLSDFEPASVFRIQLTANPPKDFDGHFAMAKKAAELGVRVRAGDQARAAIAAAKGAPDFEQKQKQVRGWAADALEKMIRDAVGKGDAKEARHCLELLTTRLNDQRTEQQLDAVAAAVEDLEGQRKQEQVSKRQARLDEKQRQSIERHLKPLETDVEKGTKAYKEALRKTATGASTKLCEQAIEHYKKAYHGLNALVEKNPDDAQLAGAAASLGKEIHDNGIRAALHAAQMLCVQSDYKNAMEWTQKVLAFDPGNADAKAMASTITTAAADSGDDWRWGWTIGDIGKVGTGGSKGRNH